MSKRKNFYLCLCMTVVIIIEDCNKLTENWYWPIDRAVTTSTHLRIYICAVRELTALPVRTSAPWVNRVNYFKAASICAGVWTMRLRILHGCPTSIVPIFRIRGVTYFLSFNLLQFINHTIYIYIYLCLSLFHQQLNYIKIYIQASVFRNREKNQCFS